MYTVIKVFLSACLLVAVSEFSKKSQYVGGLLASLPLVSVLGMMWLYRDTRDTEKVAALSTSIFWMVIPSLTLFVILPVLLKKGMSFYPAMGLSCLLTIVAYAAMTWLYPRLGIKM